MRVKLTQENDAVTHWRADFCHGQRIKFRVCDCITKHNAQYPVHAVPIYRNRAICERPCRLYAVNDTIHDHRCDRTGTVHKLCD